ncbi:hypothetical protein AB6A40_010242 [Gnathostoma spinigerum]|uniref:Uncharacterized protein n=1 Tax=Gnathostoma spinigerum TaxID=75299 RepID=A0ABD6F1D4_9BILA
MCRTSSVYNIATGHIKQSACFCFDHRSLHDTINSSRSPFSLQFFVIVLVLLHPLCLILVPNLATMVGYFNNELPPRMRLMNGMYYSLLLWSTLFAVFCFDSTVFVIKSVWPVPAVIPVLEERVK